MKLIGTIITFTVGDEIYVGTHRTVPVSFVPDYKSYVADCKSDDSTCKFCQPLQSVTIVGTTIQLTITWGAIQIKSSMLGGGDWKQKFLILYDPGGVLSGGQLKTFHQVAILQWKLNSLVFFPQSQIITLNHTTITKNPFKLLSQMQLSMLQ